MPWGLSGKPVNWYHKDHLSCNFHIKWLGNLLHKSQVQSWFLSTLEYLALLQTFILSSKNITNVTEHSRITQPDWTLFCYFIFLLSSWASIQYRNYQKFLNSLFRLMKFDMGFLITGVHIRRKFKPVDSSNHWIDQALRG